LIGSQRLRGGRPPVSKRERELRFNGKGGVKKALWNIDRCDLTRAPFFIFYPQIDADFRRLFF
jgi:hypothetical protein